MPLNLPFTAGRVDDPKLYEMLRSIQQQALKSQDFAATSPLTLTRGPSGTPLTFGFGLGLPLGTVYGGTGAAGPWTPGSVFFVGATGNFAQDNSNFFWDDTNNRLGIGTGIPDQPLTFAAGSAIHWLGGNPVAYTKPAAAAATTLNLNALSSGSQGYGGNGASLRLADDGSSNGTFLVSTNQSGVGATEGIRTDNKGYTTARLRDWGGAVFNVMAYPYGAVGDGSADDTTAINNAISAAEAATAPGIVYFPSGYKFKTTGNHTITTCSVLGGGPGTVIKLEHATNDLFVIATATSNRSDISIGNFQVTSATTRTSGWVIKYAPAYNAGFGIVRSRFFNITMQNQFNGIWIAAYEYDWMDSCIYDNPSTTGTTGSTAFKFGQTASTNINQGSEFYVSNCQSNNRGQASNSYGFWIEDCDAIYFKGCGAMAYLNSFTMTNTGHGCSNHFWTQVVADVTSNSTANNHSCWIKGTQQNVNNVITNSWFAAAQGGSDGLHIDAGAAQLWNITNSIFYNCSRYGLYAKDARILVHGNTFWGNTTADFYVDATNNTTNCGQYNNNYSYNNTASWITSANSVKCGFNGNYYTTAPTYGVGASQNVNNITY